jgi:alpha-mannosidase
VSIVGRARELLADVVEPAIFGPTAPLEVAARHLPGEPLPYGEAVAGSFEPFDVGGRWGPRWSTTWFRLRGAVPPAWAGEEVALRFEMTEPAEALLWRDGVPLVGLSWLRRDAVLWHKAEALEAVELYVEAAANPAVPPFDAQDNWPLLMPDFGGVAGVELHRCQLAVRRREVFALACDLRTVLELTEAADRSGTTDFGLLEALAAMFAVVAPDDVAGTAGEGRVALSRALDRRGDPDAHRISAVGHAHIDTAWLWPLREAARKCARSFANAVSLMEEYPEFEFAAPAARHLAWVEERWPTLFERIRERVATGQFRPVGGMWVEADCNVPSGESLVRQIVHGQRWYSSRFGQECTEMWLPDGFGFPATLPQIMAEAGMGWFVTQKLSWNEVNRFPHHTFWWQGLDGTRVRAHFPPANTYNGDMSVPELLRADGCGPRSLYPFGHGDGGGGPTREMIEAARRVTDVAGVPRVALESQCDFFAAVETDPSPLPVWVGDLYLEKHRGTFTSQAAVKLGNRRGELALAAAELWSAVRPCGGPWPADELDRVWKLLLVNQFHDILPGSSIHWVYEETAADHAEVRSVADRLSADAMAAIAAEVDTGGATEPAVVFNPTPYCRREPYGAVPAMGYAVVDRASPPAPGAVESGPGWMANGILRVEWDDAGRLTSVYDIEHDRQVLHDGRPANVFHLHHDRPREYDAWDVDRSYLDDYEELDNPVEVEVVGAGAVRFRRRFGAASSLGQTVVLTAGSRRLDFVTDVDWHERHRFLKVAFPVAVHADRATFEVQFGHVSRPTHENTPWEQARFEVCAHRWADVSEAGYGVALLNDCKYGYDVRGDVLRLSLLRAPTAPDPECDQGRHRFTYALLPHAGDPFAGGVLEAASALNTPLTVLPVDVHPGPLPPSQSFVSVDDPGFVVVAVKRADDGSGDVVVRGYEAYGGRRRVRLRLAMPFDAAYRTDLLERLRGPVPVDDGAVCLTVRSFELVTLRLTVPAEQALD